MEGRVHRQSNEDTVAVGCGVTRMTAAGSGPRSSELEDDFLPCQMEVRQRSLGQVKASTQKRRAVIREESAETGGRSGGVVRHPECSQRALMCGHIRLQVL